MEWENGSNITRGQLGHYHPFKLDLAGWKSKTIQHWHKMHLPWNKIPDLHGPHIKRTKKTDPGVNSDGF
jgi:hypothetical protein